MVVEAMVAENVDLQRQLAEKDAELHKFKDAQYERARLLDHPTDFDDTVQTSPLKRKLCESSSASEVVYTALEVKSAMNTVLMEADAMAFGPASAYCPLQAPTKPSLVARSKAWSPGLPICLRPKTSLRRLSAMQPNAWVWPSAVDGEEPWAAEPRPNLTFRLKRV